MATTSTNDPTHGLRSADPDRVQGSMGTMSDDVGRAERRGADAMERAAGAAHEGVDRLSSAASDAVDRLSSAADDTMERVSDTASRYAGRSGAAGRQVIDDARERIIAHPWRAVGIAAAAGFVIARMMR